VLAEIVENPLPKQRLRGDLHRHPLYYALRNHIIEFLVSRSRTFVSDTSGHDPRKVPLLRIGRTEPTIVSPLPPVESGPAQASGR
jgi:nitrate/nitrite transport system ATP-binding protein